MKLAALLLAAVLSSAGAETKKLTGSAKSPFKVYIDLPQGCFAKKSEGCAYRAMQDHWVQRQGFDLLLKKGSSVAFQGDREVHLLRGEVWLQAPELTVKALGRDFLLSGQMFAHIAKGQLLLKLHGGQVIHADEDPLLPGYERRYQVGQTFEPQAFDRQTETEWLLQNRVDSKIKGIDLKQWNLSWQSSLQTYAQRVQTKVDRRIASLREQQEEQERKRREARAADAEMRRMFEQRFFNPHQKTSN